MVNLTGHEAGNGGYRQGPPTARCAFLYSETLNKYDRRIPRWLRGSKQNEFRFLFSFYRTQGNSFDASVALACEKVQEREPSFEPRVLPIGLGEADRAFLRACGISAAE
jgi:hypothetical protein